MAGDLGEQTEPDEALVNLYSAKTLYQQVVFRKTLPYGTHTVRVEWTGTKYAKARGTTINVDAIDVIAGAPAGSAPTQSLTFDAANRVVGFTYDADGMRQTATVGGTTTRFAVDAVSDEIVALLDSAGAVVSSFVRDAAGALVAMVTSGAVLTYLTNAHGDVTALVDAAGAVVARWTYDAWGSPTEYDAAGNQVAVGTAGNPFLFAGYLFDVATGLYYLRARYYDPATGRFLSMHPDSGKAEDRLSQNPYIYCQNDPVNLADPDGRAAVAGGGGSNLTLWQKAQIAAIRAKRAAEAARRRAAARLAAARKAAAARLAAAKKAAAAKLAAAKKAVKKAAAKTAGVGKSLAFYAKNTVHKPKEGTADYTRYYSMQAKMYNTMADAFDTGAKVAKVALAAVIVTEAVLASILVAPVVLAASQAAGAWLVANTAGAAASGTAAAAGTALVNELADGDDQEVQLGRAAVDIVSGDGDPTNEARQVADAVREVAGSGTDNILKNVSRARFNQYYANPNQQAMVQGHGVQDGAAKLIQNGTLNVSRGPDFTFANCQVEVTTYDQFASHLAKYGWTNANGQSIYYVLYGIPQ